MKERIEALQSRVAELAMQEAKLYEQVSEKDTEYQKVLKSWSPVHSELQQAKIKLQTLQDLDKEMKGESELCQSH